MSRKYILGIDGGGTHLSGCLIDLSGEVLAFAAHPPASFPKLKEQIAEPIAKLLRELQACAGLPFTPAYAAGFCSTGIGRASEREIAERVLREKNLVEKIVAESDFLAALTGAFGGGPGIIVIAGTGAVAVGRTPSGDILRVGGWGYLLGDEGSGFALAQSALIAALKDWDGRGPQTALRQIFEQHFAVASIDLIISQIYGGEYDRGKIAELAPLVFEAAESGDGVAMAIVRQTGRELGNLVQAAVKRGQWESPIPLALIGNLFRRRERLLTAMWEVLPTEQFHLMPPRFEPVVGAALLAMLALAIPFDENFLTKLERSWHAKSSS
jgi:N-acetylglucosamine kinase-like BadF-type ATPase